MLSSHTYSNHSQELKERHVNMMAFTACIGFGLFLQSGKVIFIAGPGLGCIAFVLACTVMWAVIAALGEMTALFPVQGPLFEFPGRFLDEAVGYAVGWMAW
jgi:amino acid transporter